jgi:hypothetical protein
MKVQHLVMVVLVLLLAAPVAAAQEGWPTTCGNASRGHVPECFDKLPDALYQPSGWHNRLLQPQARRVAPWVTSRTREPGTMFQRVCRRLTLTPRSRAGWRSLLQR